MMKARNHESPVTTKPTGMVRYLKVKSPLGELLLVSDGEALTGLYFAGRNHVPARRGWVLSTAHPVLRRAAKQLEEYFKGRRTTFSLPLRLSGTEFQKRVWDQIARVPYGQTISYTDLASRAGAPAAVRAAGTTTGRNPVSIIIPCHRIVGKTGSMCGFAGGLEKKRILLDHEASNASAMGS